MTYSQELAQLSTDDFFAVIDRNSRNADLEFAAICKKRDDESLIVTLRHWQGKEGSCAKSRAAIVKAEIEERMGLLVI
jgi:hypothetical protein